MAMSITIRYFASLKENIGRGEDHLELADVATVADVWHQANPTKALPDNILVAVNMDYAALDCMVNDGDEVAFFPPVTGG
jgi:molybdopterin synthase sulfur carrier subunit